MKPQYMRPGLDFARGLAVEESGELTAALGDLQAALGKSIRWGWTSVNAELPPAKQESNAAWVRRAAETVRNEITDVLNALDRLDIEMDNEEQTETGETSASIIGLTLPREEGGAS